MKKELAEEISCLVKILNFIGEIPPVSRCYIDLSQTFGEDGKKKYMSYCLGTQGRHENRVLRELNDIISKHIENGLEEARQKFEKELEEI